MDFLTIQNEARKHFSSILKLDFRVHIENTDEFNNFDHSFKSEFAERVSAVVVS